MASATDVRDLASFEAFYGGVGAVSRRDLVDTQAAQLAGEQVYFEMAGRKQ